MIGDWSEEKGPSFQLGDGACANTVCRDCRVIMSGRRHKCARGTLTRQACVWPALVKHAARVRLIGNAARLFLCSRNENQIAIWFFFVMNKAVQRKGDQHDDSSRIFTDPDFVTELDALTVGIFHRAYFAKKP
jgi:hypothetical protein